MGHKGAIIADFLGGICLFFFCHKEDKRQGVPLEIQFCGRFAGGLVLVNVGVLGAVVSSVPAPGLFMGAV